jgi:biotin synthesis protein BioG
LNSCWQIRENRKKLLVFFNGWGMDSRPFAHLRSGSFDVLILYDYRSLSLPLEFSRDLENYQEIYILAWSLGVWVCQALGDIFPSQPVFSLALNGTGSPIHPRYGIPPAIFNTTLKKLSPAVLENFYGRMFSRTEETIGFLQNPPERPLSEQREELEFLQQRILAVPTSGQEQHFDAVLISKQDLIMPAQNQLRFWNSRCPCHLLTSGHFPFFRWQQWESILAEAGYG